MRALVGTPVRWNEKRQPKLPLSDGSGPAVYADGTVVLEA
jgi:hypothetical protein